MKIISDKNGWVTAIVEGRWCQAKVYDLPSTYGVNNGRVSKIGISKTNTRDPFVNYFEQMDFHYDRGLDFSSIDEGLLNRIIDEFESLPQSTERNKTY